MGLSHRKKGLSRLSGGTSLISGRCGIDSSIYASQLFQDRRIIEVVFPQKLGGFFVEVGASDGVSLSNTIVLERNFNWSGICIEPSCTFSELCSNRNCISENAVIWSHDGEMLEFLTSNESVLGIDRLHHLSGVSRTFDKYSPIGSTSRVSSRTLASVLREHNAPTYIEYLSIDTEGSEFEVLKGLDLSSYKFGAITVEHNFVQPKRSNVKALLNENGYVLYSEVLFDDWYVHESTKLSSLEVPPWLPTLDSHARG